MYVLLIIEHNGDFLFYLLLLLLFCMLHYNGVILHALVVSYII